MFAPESQDPSLAASNQKMGANMLAINSAFSPIEEEGLWEGTRVLATLEKISSCCLILALRKDSRQFPDELFWNILSTVAVRSTIGQGLSCFCLDVIFGGVDYSVF